MAMLIVLFLMVGLFLTYILAPFFSQPFRNKRLPADSSQLENLRFKKDEVLSAIEDVKYDYRMKKITEADYLQANEKLSREAVEVMKKIDQLEEEADGDARASVRTGSRKANSVGS